MTALFQDVKYALRSFVKSPGFSAIAVVTLALGIGANAAIFALVDRVLLRLLPVQDPQQLVLLRSPGPMQGHGWSDADIATSFSYPMYKDLRDQNTVFTGLLGQYPFAASVSGGGQTERAQAELVTGNYFPILGVSPAAGRILTPADDEAPGAHPVVVLSHGYWSRRFGGDRAILNKTIVVNGQPLTIVGVSRSGFTGIQPGRQTDLFVPLAMKTQMTPFWNGLDDPKDYWLQLVGRLKSGITARQAQARLQATYRPLLQAHLSLISSWSEESRRQFVNKPLLLDAGGHGRAVMRSSAATPLLSLMGMVGLVLLIACTNLAGLLAARGAARQREYGVRLAIGASRFQLLRQSVVECLIFAVAGGGVGILVAVWTLNALLRAFPPDADVRQVAAQVDPRVLGFAAVLSLLAGLLFGLAPALRAARLDPARTLRGQGRGTLSAGREVLSFRRWLVTGQVALTLVLLVASGLFVRSLVNLGRVELGLKPDAVIGFTVAPGDNGYTAERSAALGRSLTEALKTLPGVRSVSAAEVSTFTGDTSGTNVKVQGYEPKSGEDTHANTNAVGPDYFATLGIPLISGREITWQDGAGSPKVAVINETMARKLLPGRNPLGVRISFRNPKDAFDTEIVGVVANSKSAEVGEPDRPFLYTPYLQDQKLAELTFYLRSQQSPDALASSIRSEVARVDPGLPIFNLKTLRGQLDESLVTERLLVLLSAAFGGLAALLAALGVYGVLAFAVEQRRREIGIRIALGADPASLRRLVLSEVAGFLAIGGAIGLPAAFGLGKVVESILYGVRATDVSVFVGGAILMAAVALAAAYPPAHRASRTNAMEALRSD